MFFIYKPNESPKAFKDIVTHFTSYQSLTEAPTERDKIKLLLLNEQGCPCPYCEKRLDISSATIEHFLPKSSFPHLQLAHSNLFACCGVCNGKKSHHLLPAYIFDNRLDCIGNDFFHKKKEIDFNLYYHEESFSSVVLQIPHLSKLPKKTNAQYYSDSILYTTIELLCLNDPKRLKEHRGAAYFAMLELITSASSKKLESILFSLKSMEKDGEYWMYEEFISMKIQILTDALRKTQQEIK